jgi:signal transduction histidine kinase
MKEIAMTKVLVIEDEDQIREEVMDWLQFEGYEVSGAENGRKGLESARHAIPDLILSDIAMPELDGREVLLDIRSNPQLSHIPFIFMTASAERESVRRGMEMGADDYLTKPFSHSELLNAVRSRLEKKIALDTQVQTRVSMLNSALSEEREKNLLKTRLVAMFSHDFRNPLTLILTSSDMIRNFSDQLSQEQTHKYLDRIEGSVRSLVQMLDDMLMVAEMESGNLKYMPKTVELTPFVEEIVEEFRLIYSQTKKFILHSTIEGNVEVDPKLFRQLLTNLISNAAKYSSSGSVVNITLLDKDEILELTVEDHGIGIPAIDIERLFEPFHRASNAKNIKGTGLGLVIVKQAVDLHNGEIKIESVEGKGTKFIVQIPDGLAKELKYQQTY